MNMVGDSARTRMLVEKFTRQKILVVGDMMLDHYIRGSVSRISPEAPVPVVRVTSEHNAPGGAANVARNVSSLGGRSLMCGVVGEDQAGRELLKALEREGVSTEAVMLLPRVRTTVKTRILAGRQQIVRVDWDGRLDLDADQWAAFCARAALAARDASGIIIEDYARGAVRQDLVAAVVSEGRRRDIPIAFDPKKNAELDVRGITVVTPNRAEAFVLAGVVEGEPCEDPLRDAPLMKVSKTLMDKWNPDFLIVTLGALGMLLWKRDAQPRHISTVAREVFDVSGAGDTVVAALLLALASGAAPEEAARLANCAAGVVVGKVGTASCSVEELFRFQTS